MKYQWFPWNGSKRWLLPELETVFKGWDGKGQYIEPFVGGGSVSMLIRNLFPLVNQTISDANPWLMAAYEAQKNNNISCEFLDVQYYRELSDADLNRLSTEEKAKRFAICLLTAWGNRWETYPNGRFRSTKNKAYCEECYLRKRLETFFSVRWIKPSDVIKTGDWKHTLSTAKSGDLVYLDPPYPESLGYGNQWWSFSDQLDVVDWAEYAIQNGINIVVSNMSTLERLYRRCGMRIKIVEGPNPSKTKRQRDEVIAWFEQ